VKDQWKDTSDAEFAADTTRTYIPPKGNEYILFLDNCRWTLRLLVAVSSYLCYIEFLQFYLC